MAVRFGECVLDSETRQLFVRGEEIHLQPKALQLLELLIRNRPRAVSKEAIHAEIWPGTFVSDGTVTSLLAEIREAIGDDAHESRFVRTVHRFGYAFCGPAQETGARLSPLAGRKVVHWLVRGRRRIPLEPGETIIGRDPGAGIFIDDRSVSRRHARILVTDDVAVLEDLSSKNGTFIQERRVEGSFALSDGDKVRIGSVPVTVRIFAVPESTDTGREA
ncbi:MAG TPA: FHA domain-containing protein [Thermoanaerobaculia bacterium]|nr:FHA domain-containing protein [Thermoanaerobaculia bacterium]